MPTKRVKTALGIHTDGKRKKVSTEMEDNKKDVKFQSIYEGRFGNLKLEDIECPICLSILVEPVTMPCKHTLCHGCFDENVAQTSFTCPLCRMRIGVWIRKAKKSGKLVDFPLWNWIQKNFAEKLEARRMGKDYQTLHSQPTPCLSEPGEIAEDFELQRKLILEQELKKQREQEEATLEALRKLETERRAKESELELLCKGDEELAKRCREQQMIEKRTEIFGGSPVLSLKKPSKTIDIYFGQQTPSSSGTLTRHPHRPSPAEFSHDKSATSSFVTLPVKTNVASPLRNRNSDIERELPIKLKSGKENTVEVGFDRESQNIESSKRVESKIENYYIGNKTRSSERGKKADHQSKSVSNASKSTCEADVINTGVCKIVQKSDGGETSVSYRRVKGLENKRKLDIAETEETSLVERSNVGSTSSNEDLSCRTHQFLDVMLPDSSIEVPFDLGKMDPNLLAQMVEEQKMEEERLNQENEDRKLAQQMEKEMRTVNRKKGSEDEYSLRNIGFGAVERTFSQERAATKLLKIKDKKNKRRKVESNIVDGRQATIVETLRKRRLSEEY